MRGGLGIAESNLVYLPRGDGFVVNGRRVSRTQIESLVRALQAPIIDDPNMENLGIDQEWLTGHADATFHEVSWAGEPNQQALFRAAYTNRSVISSLIPHLFAYALMDDNSVIKVELKLADGTAWFLSSSSYYDFMLPWKISMPGVERETFDAGVSRALAAILPSKTVNLDRIRGDELCGRLARYVMDEIKDRWNALDVENRAASSLDILRAQFTVERVSINPYHSPAYGKEWKKGESQEVNLHALLHRPSYFPNFHQGLVLEYRNGTVQGMERFLRLAPTYEQLTQSVPWLGEFLATHPKTAAEMLFVHDSSVGDHALQVFAADMTAIGKRRLAEEVRGVRQDAVLLALGYGGYWILLPDRRMILWRYSSSPGLLKWGEADFSPRRCSSYNDIHGGCVGAVVSADGNVITK